MRCAFPVFLCVFKDLLWSSSRMLPGIGVALSYVAAISHSFGMWTKCSRCCGVSRSMNQMIKSREKKMPVRVSATSHVIRPDDLARAGQGRAVSPVFLLLRALGTSFPLRHLDVFSVSSSISTAIAPTRPRNVSSSLPLLSLSHRPVGLSSPLESLLSCKPLCAQHLRAPSIKARDGNPTGWGIQPGRPRRRPPVGDAAS